MIPDICLCWVVVHSMQILSVHVCVCGSQRITSGVAPQTLSTFFVVVVETGSPFHWTGAHHVG